MTENPPKILTPAEVARLFRVDPKTVTRWAKAGKIPYFMTVGGHRRFREDQIMQVLHKAQFEADAWNEAFGSSADE